MVYEVDVVETLEQQQKDEDIPVVAVEAVDDERSDDEIAELEELEGV